jgi:hypothetical protein
LTNGTAPSSKAALPFFWPIFFFRDNGHGAANAAGFGWRNGG